MKPAISFIFVNFQSARLFGAALSSLEQAIRREELLAEYIVVNNDPTEREALESVASHVTGSRIVHQVTNGGFGRANNIGAQLASGELLFFVNPDTELERANFRGLLEAFRFRPTALYGMALTQSSGEREPWSAGAYPSLARIAAAHLAPWLLPRPWLATAVQRANWVSAAAFALRRDFFHSLGGFDESFFLYFEDVDFARRATKAGAWVGIYPFIGFRHAGGQSHASDREKKEAYYRGQREYFRKWRPAYESALLSLAHAIRHIFLRQSL